MMLIQGDSMTVKEAKKLGATCFRVFFNNNRGAFRLIDDLPEFLPHLEEGEYVVLLMPVPKGS